MSLKLGNTNISELYVGSTKIGTAYLGSTKVYEGSAPSPGGEVLLYDNNTSLYKSGTYSISIEPTRRYVVIMFNQSASTSGSVYAASWWFRWNEQWRSRCHFQQGNYSVSRSFNGSLTWVASNGSVRKVDGTNNYYWTTKSFSELKTYKHIIDTQSSVNNVKQYVGNTYVCYSSLNISGPITEFGVGTEVQTNKAPTLNTFRIAQFDNEEDAIAYNGEQTI